MIPSADELLAGNSDLVEGILRLRLLAFDFDGVFTDNAVIVLEDGREAVRCSRFDGLGLRRLEACGVEPIILSTEINPVVRTRAAKLGIRARNGLDNKVAALQEEMDARGLAPDQVGYVGNDINDEACLRTAGLPIVIADCHPEVLHLAKYRTKLTGGNGAVREICDLVHSVRARCRVAAAL